MYLYSLNSYNYCYCKDYIVICNKCVAIFSEILKVSLPKVYGKQLGIKLVGKK